MRRIIVTACVVLAACATPAQKQARLEARAAEAVYTCRALGFQDGTPEGVQCALGVMQQREAGRQAAAETMLGVGLGMMATQPRPAQISSCRWVGSIWTCTQF